MCLGIVSHRHQSKDLIRLGASLKAEMGIESVTIVSGFHRLLRQFLHLKLDVQGFIAPYEANTRI